MEDDGGFGSFGFPPVVEEEDVVDEDVVEELLLDASAQKLLH